MYVINVIFYGDDIKLYSSWEWPIPQSFYTYFFVNLTYSIFFCSQCAVSINHKSK